MENRTEVWDGDLVLDLFLQKLALLAGVLYHYAELGVTVDKIVLIASCPMLDCDVSQLQRLVEHALDCDVSHRQRLVEHALSPVDEFLSVLSRPLAPLRHLVGEAQLVVEQCAQRAVVSAVTQEVQLRMLVLSTQNFNRCRCSG